MFQKLISFISLGAHRRRFKAAATFKIELFVLIVNGFQPLTIITKCSILDVAAVQDPPLPIVENH